MAGPADRAEDLAPDGSGHAFLLTPVPEPSRLGLLATRLAWLSLGYARRLRTSPRSGIGRRDE
jgi:hypothetical protein